MEEKNGFAMMLMILTLLVSLMLLCLVKPLRAPALNDLDVDTSDIRIVLKELGAVAVYSGALRSNFMSRTLSFLACSFLGRSLIIVFLNGIQ